MGRKQPNLGFCIEKNFGLCSATFGAGPNAIAYGAVKAVRSNRLEHMINLVDLLLKQQNTRTLQYLKYMPADKHG